MMQSEAVQINWSSLPSEIQPFISETQTALTPGRMYSIFAISVYRRVMFFLIVDDLNMPVFVPSILFRRLTTNLPSDWVCSTSLGHEVDLVLGPEFIAQSLEGYNAMVDQERDAVEALRAYRKQVMTE
jgi:hypothetical protein